MSERRLKLRIVTPVQVKYEAEVRALRFPGLDGLFGVLPRHAAMISVTESGALSATAADGSRVKMVVHEGFAEVRDDVVTVLTRAAEKPEEVDLERARQAAQRARDRLRARENDVDFARAYAALRRALARQRLARP